MQFVEIIKRWLENDATKSEIEELHRITSRVLSISDTEMIEKAIEIMNKESSLAAVKYIKDKTGWYLKESKEFYDTHVKPFKESKEVYDNHVKPYWQKSEE